MALKIDTNQSATAYHIVDGPTVFPYAIDAQHAISNHPLEWRDEPWSQEDSAAARKESGLPEIELTPEEQAAVDEHAKAVYEANERLAHFREMKAQEKAYFDRVAADEALVRSPAPRPDPTARKALTPAQIRKRASETDDERITREKLEADQIGNALANVKA